ncbi:MAG: hypothetical protein GXO60_03445 [Epsilonproteobacteria bacterium]|nr:hypothetical protein [Campylobacterota bacterium]
MDNKSQQTTLDKETESITIIDEDTSNENVEKNSENSEIQNEENIEQKEPTIKNKPKKPATKNEKAKELMKTSAELISKANSEVEATKQNVIEDVNRFEELKNTLLNTSFTQSQILLEKVSYEYSKPEVDEPFEISLGTTDEDIRLHNITSGGFTGFIFATLAMVGTAAGWVFVASKKVGVELNPPAIPDEASINKILTWIGGGMTGGEGNAIFGMATIGITSLLVGWSVYKLRVMLKEHKNYKIANETFEKSHKYVEKQKESKTEIEKIDEHVKKVVPLLESYKVLLDEQNAKLQRIIHVEGILEDNSQYHQASQKEMQESERLMEKLEALITIPVTKNGKLNEKSVEALNEAKAVYEYYISKIYA